MSLRTLTPDAERTSTGFLFRLAIVISAAGLAILVIGAILNPWSISGGGDSKLTFGQLPVIFRCGLLTSAFGLVAIVATVVIGEWELFRRRK